MVLHLAKLAQNAGASGVVASAQDIALLRDNFGDEFVIVTPGIRSAAAATKDDQKRTLSAYEAVKTGADYIVVGRPIRTAAGSLGSLPANCSGNCRRTSGKMIHS